MSSDELREKCREVILTHLRSRGYPNLTMRGVLNEIKPMWIALEEAGLMEEIKAHGHTFEEFQSRAVKRAQESAFDQWVEGLAERMTKTKRRIK